MKNVGGFGVPYQNLISFTHPFFFKYAGSEYADRLYGQEKKFYSHSRN